MCDIEKCCIHDSEASLRVTPLSVKIECECGCDYTYIRTANLPDDIAKTIKNWNELQEKR